MIKIIYALVLSSSLVSAADTVIPDHHWSNSHEFTMEKSKKYEKILNIYQAEYPALKYLRNIVMFETTFIKFIKKHENMLNAFDEAIKEIASWFIKHGGYAAGNKVFHLVEGLLYPITLDLINQRPFLSKDVLEGKPTLRQRIELGEFGEL